MRAGIQGNVNVTNCRNLSQLGTKQAEEVIEEFAEEVSALEFFGGQLPGVALVRFESPRQRGGKARVEHIEIRLIIDLEGPVIEVDRTGRDPNVVHDHDFAVIQ